MKYEPKIAPWPQAYGELLPVSEIFSSIQGEGRFAGHPAMFIRLKYCNLGCAWCDTRFTWDPDKLEPGELLSPAQIATRVEKLIGGDVIGRKAFHVVITGGEPMLHQDRIPVLINRLKNVGLEFFEIETNGMFVPSAEMTREVSWWNCSPKLTNNGLTTEQNLVESALHAFAATGQADFKFVVKSEADIDEIKRDYLPHIPADSVILMPEGWTVRRQLELMPSVIQLAAKHGFRFSPRLHILAWGNERGR